MGGDKASSLEDLKNEAVDLVIESPPPRPLLLLLLTLFFVVAASASSWFSCAFLFIHADFLRFFSE